MPTAAERQALLFLISVALLGGGVRAYESHRRSTLAIATASAGDSDEGVDTQLAAVDSARNSPRASSRRKRTSVRKSAVRDSDNVRQSARQSGRERTRQVEVPVAIDVDVASAEELERLPRVGPALAQRIVANRDSLGGFGSPEALTRVRGIGPALARQLAPLVTFSSGPSPFHAEPRKRSR